MRKLTDYYSLEEIVLNNVEHGFDLTEDEGPVGADDRVSSIVRGCVADSAVCNTGTYIVLYIVEVV